MPIANRGQRYRRDCAKAEAASRQRPGRHRQHYKYNTSTECKKACVSHDVTGVWRGLHVDQVPPTLWVTPPAGTPP